MGKCTLLLTVEKLGLRGCPHRGAGENRDRLAMCEGGRSQVGVIFVLLFMECSLCPNSRKDGSLG